MQLRNNVVSAQIDGIFQKNLAVTGNGIQGIAELAGQIGKKGLLESIVKVHTRIPGDRAGPIGYFRLGFAVIPII